MIYAERIGSYTGATTNLTTKTGASATVGLVQTELNTA